MGAPKSDKSGVKKVWQALTDAGYTINVVDAENEEFPNQSKTDAVANVMTCDDGYFLVFQDGERIGWVWFVFGNSPEEVVSDHSVSLSHVLDPLTRGWWN